VVKESDASITHMANGSKEYFLRLQSGISNIRHDEIAVLAQQIEQTCAAGGNIWIAGNGGSAATASHMAVDLSFGVRPGGKIRAISLSDSVSSVTATGNDVSFEEIFSRQLKGLARSGDLLILISASGNSPNLFRAFDEASSMGVKTAAILGFDGGLLASKVHYPVLAECQIGDYGVAEDLHLAINHCLKELLNYGE